MCVCVCVCVCLCVCLCVCVWCVCVCVCVCLCVCVCVCVFVCVCVCVCVCVACYFQSYVFINFFHFQEGNWSDLLVIKKKLSVSHLTQFVPPHRLAWGWEEIHSPKHFFVFEYEVFVNWQSDCN